MSKRYWPQRMMISNYLILKMATVQRIIIIVGISTEVHLKGEICENCEGSQKQELSS